MDIVKKAQYFLYSTFLAQGTPSGGVQSDVLEAIGNLFPSSDVSLGGQRTLGGLIFFVIQILLIVAASITVIFLIVGGFQYVAARGNEEATEKAKKTITGSIIGLVVIVLAYAIVSIVIALLYGETGIN